MPLIWVNPAFTATTGYSFEEAVGRNCRFLQGDATDPEAPRTMREALESGRDVSLPVLNYRKDGSAFWNHVSISPIHGPDGELTHFVGIQTDVTARVAVDEERDRALTAERAAREDAEAAHAQLALLAEATSQLASTLDVDESLQRLMALVVPKLADWMLIATAGKHGEVAHVRARHRDGREEELRTYTELLERTSTRGSILNVMLEGAPPRLLTDYSSRSRRPERRQWVEDESVLDMSDRLGSESVLFVPLPGRRHVTGVMALVRGPGSTPYTEHDLAVASDLGRRAGLILDNARLYESEHRIAETLQRSLLPDLPTIPGIRAAARYLASETGADVGGDFYELIDLPDGAIGLAIGDVIGHDVLAAAAMGHLRGLLRACAFDVEEGPGRDPAAVLERVDRLVQGLQVATLSSVTYARLEAQPDGTWRLRYSSGGHPPLLVRRPDGTVDTLTEADGLLLGVDSTPRVSAAVSVAPGSTLLAYTDGLVERRGEDLDVGIERLRRALAAGPQEVGELCDHLLAELGDSEDDVAVLAIAL
nr:SpoIIE family protein phosphatase [Motilibacter aurantiacus]